MKSVSSRYKEAIRQYGKQIDIIITYTDKDGEHLLDSDVLFSITPTANGNILKSVMKQLDFESSIKVNKGTLINVKFGVLVDLSLTVKEINEMMVSRLNSLPVKYLSSDLKGFEYICLGNYIVSEEPEYNADTQSYLHICHDKMLYSMKDYEKLDITYPITVREYINNICKYLGLTFKNKNTTFANYNKQIKADLYDGYDYTFRDILDELAQVTASTICINENTDELEIRYINNTGDSINEDYLKDTNVTFSEKYGPVNSVVLSRSAESDNVFLRNEDSVNNNGLCEIKIIDNQIMNDNDRSDFLPDILSKLDGLEYYINDFNSPGITWYELCDKYTVEIENNLYNCILFNDEIKITQGLEETIYTEIPESSKTDYSKADKTDKKINKAYRIVDKQNQIIEDLLSQQDGTSKKLAQHEQTIDSMKDTLSSQETKIETIENKADNAQSTANTANTNAQNAQTTADGAITQITTINSKVTEIEETVDGITQSVSAVEEKVETVESTANTAKTTADNVNENLATNYYTKTEANSQINQKADEISQTVSETYSTKTETEDAKTDAINSANNNIDNKLKDYSTTSQMNSAITQKAGEISTEVSQKVENVQIGGTNLIPNSAPYNIEKWVTNDSNAIDISIQEEPTAPLLKSIRIWTLQALTAEKGIYIIPTTKVLKVGQEYCFSLWLKSTANMKVKVGYAKGGQTTFNITTEWTKYTHKFIATEPTAESHGFVIYLPTGTIKGRQVFVHSVKLEEGNKVTGWCPAPEDNVTGYEFGTKIEQNVEHVKVAWNKISEYLQMEVINGNASLAIRNETKKLLMALDKLGQHFFNGNYSMDTGAFDCYFPSYGQTYKSLMFALNEKATNNFMAWGYKGTTENGGIVYTPIVFLGGQSDSDYGFHVDSDLFMGFNAIRFKKSKIYDNNDSLMFEVGEDIFIGDTRDGTEILSIYNNNGGSKTVDFHSCRVKADNLPTFDTTINHVTGSANHCIGLIFKDGSSVYVYADSSDKKLKKNIKKSENNALEKILRINHKQFDWKSNNEHQEIGYIAQEMQKIDKTFVHYAEFETSKGERKENWQINTLSVLATATKAIQEQQELIEKQQKQIEENNKTIQDLLTRVENLEKGANK